MNSPGSSRTLFYGDVVRLAGVRCRFLAVFIHSDPFVV